MAAKRHQLRGDDDADLEQLQKEFLGGQKQPAAQVFRVGHAKQTAPEPEYSQGAPEADAQDVLGSAAPLDVSAPASGGFLQAMADILGEVQEREVREGSSAAPIMPTKDPFPVAAHRKASKFALGRSRQKPNADVAAPAACAAAASVLTLPSMSSTAATTALPAAASASGEPDGQLSIGRSIGSVRSVVGRTAASSARQGLTTDMQAAEDEAEARLAAMTPKEIMQEQRDLQARLSPGALAFFQRRAARKQAGASKGLPPTPQTSQKLSLAASATAPKDAEASATCPNTEAAIADSGSPGTHNRPPMMHASPAWQVESRALDASTSQAAVAAASEDAATAVAVKGTPPLVAATHPAATRQVLSEHRPSMPAQPPLSTSPAQQPAFNALAPGSQPLMPQTAEQPGSGIQAPMAGRLRFGLDGEVLGVDPEGQGAGAADVVSRDLLRQDEGTAAEGYTIREACTLVRSSLPKQRVLALRMLGTILSRARPDGLHSARPIHLASGAAETAAAAPTIPSSACPAGSPEAASQSGEDISVSSLPGPRASVSEQMQQPGISGAPAQRSTAQRSAARQLALDWKEVWEYALQEADIAVVLRRALDDRDLAVIAAAAEAILALVGGPVNRELPFGIADACPVTGLPCVPVRFLERPHPIGAWVANPTEPYVPQTRQELEEDAEEPPDAAKVARFDPLIGLVQMQVLPRIRYVLDVARSPGAVQPLLDTLIHVAQAGHDTSQAVYQCPGLWRSVLGVLTSLPPAGRDASAVEGAYYGMRPKALTLVRVMCQASADLARELLQSGAGAAACRFLSASAMSDGSLGVAARDVPAMHLQVEAMRIWQTSAAYGVPLIHLDDVYPTICRYFEAQAGAAGAAPDAQQTAGPASPAPSAGAAGSRSGAAESSQRALADQRASAAAKALSETWSLLASCQAFLTLAQLVHQSNQAQALNNHRSAAAAALSAVEADLEQSPGNPSLAMMSAGSAAVLAQQAQHWLKPSALQWVLGALPASHGRSAAGAERGKPGEAWLRVSLLAAVLHFLAAYWQAQAQPQAQANTQAVDALGPVRKALLSSHLLASPAEQPASTGALLTAQLLAITSTACPPGDPAASRLRAAASELLLGVAYLAAAVLLQQPLGSTPAPVPLFLTRLVRHLGPQTVAVAQQHQPQSVKVEPWDRESLQGDLHRLQTLVPVLELQQARSAGSGPATADLAQQAEQQQQGGAGVEMSRQAQPHTLDCPIPAGSPWPPLSWPTAVLEVDAALASLALMPPGSERLALRALSSALRPDRLAKLRAAAERALQQFQHSGSAFAAAACGGTAAPWGTEHTASIPPTGDAAQGRKGVTADLPEAAGAAVAPRGTEHTANHAATAADGTAAKQSDAGIPSATGSGLAAAEGQCTYPLPKLPGPVDLQRVLLQGYAAAWLGLVPDGQQEHSMACASPHDLDQQGAQGHQQPQQPQQHQLLGSFQAGAGLLLRPVGSRLPTPYDWPLLEIMADAAVPRGKQREEALPGRSGAATLPTIAEGAASGESSEDEEGSGAAASFDQGTAVGCVLTLMLGLEASGSAYTAGMDPGRKLKDMLDLVFSPQAGSGPGTELEPESELWLDPLVRWPLAALLHFHTQPGDQQQRSASSAGSSSVPNAETAAMADTAQLQQDDAAGTPVNSMAGEGGVSADDAQRWAEQFAAVSYGDPLFGAVLALLLRPDMPSAVQGTVLQVLADQRVLHALPSLADAPGGPPAFLAGPPPRDIIELYAQLLQDSHLERASETNSLVPELARHHVALHLFGGGGTAGEACTAGEAPCRGPTPGGSSGVEVPSRAGEGKWREPPSTADLRQVNMLCTLMRRCDELTVRRLLRQSIGGPPAAAGLGQLSGKLDGEAAAEMRRRIAFAESCCGGDTALLAKLHHASH